MATQLPDHRTLKSWEEAFTNSSVPTVRQLERQIRHDISTNRERLRSLVGGSYRDLLSTAETIGSMDKRMRNLEGILSDDIGRKCNTGLLERTNKRSKALLDQAKSPEDTFALAAQLAVFKACPEAIIRILKTREGSLLTAAKVLVIYRILYTEKLKPNRRFAGTVQGIFKRLSPIRDKLLAAIDRRIGSIPDQTPEKLLDAICAYSLATSSSGADLLRHFHHVRSAAVGNALRRDSNSDSDPVKALETWIQTLKDTQTLFPRPVVNALNQLKAKPLISGEDVSIIASFELEVRGAWLGDNVRNYVPYIRLDDLDLSTAKAQLSSWAPATLQSFLRDLRTSLKTNEDFASVASIRRACLAAWFSGSSRIGGVPRGDVLDGLRKAFAEQMAELIESRCDSLSSVATETRNVFEAWDMSNVKPFAPSLWDVRTTDIENSSGDDSSSHNLLQASIQGRSRSGDKICRGYQDWLQNIDSIERAVDEQRKIRWQDLNEDYDDESDEEELRDQTLSKDDPDKLQRKLVTCVTAAIDRFQASLHDLATDDTGTTDRSPLKAAFTLRLIRDFENALPALYTNGFATETKSLLWTRISEPIAASVLGSHGDHMLSLLRKQLVVRNLWSGDPELPVMPSPWTFRLLRSCHSAMEAAGPDLWTAGAVAVLKRLLTNAMSESLTAFRKDVTSGEEKEDDAEVDRWVQQLFDVHYLATALIDGGADRSSLFHEHHQWLLKASCSQEESVARITKSAQEYWKRTSLLFALL